MQIGCRSRRLFVEGDELFCSMLGGYRFDLEDSTVFLHFEGVSDITNPPSVPCSVLYRL